MFKFIASNKERAKDKARRAFGDKTVIVSERNLPSGDVEITASDKPSPAAPAATSDWDSFAPHAREDINRGRQSGQSGSRLNETLEQRFSEDALSKVTTNLSGRSGSSTTLELNDEKSRVIHDALKTHGMSDTLISSIISGAQNARINDDYHLLETGFSEAFAFAPLNFNSLTPIMLVGPTGAGKTSSSAKLAKTAIDHGLHALMLTADVGRAGAIEQLKTYGTALGAEYHIAETPNDVHAAITRSQQDRFAILDTPGISPFDAGDVAALRSFCEAARAEPVLVLPASGDLAEYNDWAQAFAEFGVRRAIVTKFDATRRVGAGLSALFDANIALAHVSETPFIAEGIRDATPEFLTRRFLASKPGKVL